ncbi:hypothetical protein [Mycobacterium sp. URHB0021]
MSDITVDPQLHTGKADVNGARLYYEERGEGPSLLFIPAAASMHGITPRSPISSPETSAW